MATKFQFTNYCYLFCILIISISTARFIIRILTNSTKLRPPPSPPALPFIGHLHLLSSTLPKSFETLAKRWGPLMQIRMGDAACVIISDANTAEKVLKTHDADCASKFEPGPTQQLMYKGATFFNSPYGPYWRFMKKLCVTKLFGGSQLDRFTHIREKERMKLLKFLVQRSVEGESCDLSMELEAVTNHTMYSMVMGKRCTSQAYSDQAVEIRRIIMDIMELGSKFPLFEVFGPLKKLDLSGNGRRIKSVFLRYDQKLEQIIQEYEENRTNIGEREERDVMDILLETYKDTNAEFKLTKNHIKYFIMEIFMAVVDSTATTMQSAMAELINRPHAFKKLREEINTVVGSNRLITESDVPNLPYLQAIFKEILRLYPPASLLWRTCAVDTKINGYDVKSGTKIFVNIHAIMRDPNTWKEPDKFLPERFLEPGSQQMDFKGQDFRFLPFGSGRRACLGSSYALSVMLATVGSLVQCFDWKLKGVDKADIDTVTGDTGALAHSLVCYPIICFDPFNA
ncbi:putative Cytochrome P450 [Melia azedarach]|uniref:Cytochrome P450 n=1 Tax=Melia azedarach TaxID=155640 RepID=A0ACC1X725_MELAZ|nr:putative Cytochrome P450 [Melia azedarach]